VAGTGEKTEKNVVLDEGPYTADQCANQGSK
jgi:hypothetical protein